MIHQSVWQVMQSWVKIIGKSDQNTYQFPFCRCPKVWHDVILLELLCSFMQANVGAKLVLSSYYHAFDHHCNLLPGRKCWNPTNGHTDDLLLIVYLGIFKYNVSSSNHSTVHAMLQGLNDRDASHSWMVLYLFYWFVFSGSQIYI